MITIAQHIGKVATLGAILDAHLAMFDMILIDYDDGPWAHALFFDRGRGGAFQAAYLCDHEKQFSERVIRRNGPYQRFMHPETLPSNKLLAYTTLRREHRFDFSRVMRIESHTLAADLFPDQPDLHQKQCEDLTTVSRLIEEGADYTLLLDQPRFTYPGTAATELFSFEVFLRAQANVSRARLVDQFLSQLDQEALNLVRRYRDAGPEEYNWITAGHGFEYGYNPRAQAVATYPELLSVFRTDPDFGNTIGKCRSLSDHLSSVGFTQKGQRALRDLPLYHQNLYAISPGNLTRKIFICNLFGELPNNVLPRDTNERRNCQIVLSCFADFKERTVNRLSPKLISALPFSRWARECGRLGWIDANRKLSGRNSATARFISLRDFLSFLEHYHLWLGRLARRDLIPWIQQQPLFRLLEMETLYHSAQPTAEREIQLQRLSLLGIDDFDSDCWPGLTHTVLYDNFRIVPLNSVEDLLEEGEEMCHCVGSHDYIEASRLGDSRIYSIHRGNERLATVELELIDDPLPDNAVQLGQVQGPENSRVEHNVWQATQHLLFHARNVVPTVEWIDVRKRYPKEYAQSSVEFAEHDDLGDMSNELERRYTRLISNELATKYPRVFGE